MSVGFFKKTHDHQHHKIAKKAPTSHQANVVSLFPKTHVSIQRVLELQRKEELSDAARLQNSIRALLQHTNKAPSPHSLFRAPKPKPGHLSKKSLLDKLAIAPTPILENDFKPKF